MRQRMPLKGWSDAMAGEDSTTCMFFLHVAVIRVLCTSQVVFFNVVLVQLATLYSANVICPLSSRLNGLGTRLQDRAWVGWERDVGRWTWVGLGTRLASQALGSLWGTPAIARSRDLPCF